MPEQKLATEQSSLKEPDMERVEALADISRSALCCHSNETLAPIANLPDSTQLVGTACHIRVRAVVWECDKGQADTQTDRQTRVTNIRFASVMPHAKRNEYVNNVNCCNVVYATLRLLIFYLLN